MPHLIRATNLWGYPELVTELGGEPGDLLNRFHIRPGIEREGDSFVPFEAALRLLEASAEEMDCPDFGLRLSRWQGLDILGPVAVIARNAETVLHGVAAVARYLYVHSPALELAMLPDDGRGDLAFTYRIDEPGASQQRQGYELSMGNAVRIVRLLAGEAAGPSTVSFQHSQLGSDQSYVEALGCPALFDQEYCGFELPREVAMRKIDAADPESRRIATRYLEAEYVPGDVALSSRVSELARRLLPTGQCTVEVIADHLTLHARTLQRRLRAEDTRCQDLIDTERRALAVRYLKDPRFGLAQVAGLLGYEEQSSLNRSCQRWFGMTPRRYRSELLLAPTS